VINLAELLAPQGDPVAIKRGTVTLAPGTGVVTVAVNGTDLVLPHLRGYVPAVDDSVIILAMGQSWVVVDAYTNPSQPVAPRGTPAPAPSQPKPTPPPPDTKTTVTTTFLAASTGCFRSGKWRTDTGNQPHQGDWNGAYGRNKGAWFYGTAIRSALAGSDVIKAEIYMKRISGGVYGSVSPTIYTTPHATRPAGDMTLLGSGTDLHSMAVDTAGWFTFPTSLAQQYSDGSAYGLACWVNADDPYMAFANLTTSRSSGALRLTYQKG
jgi:hypothetical protein